MENCKDGDCEKRTRGTITEMCPACLKRYQRQAESMPSTIYVPKKTFKEECDEEWERRMKELRKKRADERFRKSAHYQHFKEKIAYPDHLD